MSNMRHKIYSFLSLVLLLSSATVANAQTKKAPIKLIVDCDLGDDIDDAYALSLVLTSPEFDVLGVVADYGNTPERARMSAKLLSELKRKDIPVIEGRQTTSFYAPQFYWSKGYDGSQQITKGVNKFYKEIVQKYPGEVVLLTLGPVPNMQDILKKDPSILSKFKHVYSMFGSFYMGYERDVVPDAEWNVKADIPAAKAFIAAPKNVTLIPLDVTTFVKLHKDNREMIAMRHSVVTDFLSSCYPLWRHMSYATHTPTLYDAVAVGSILWPDLFTYRKAHVNVTDDGYTTITEGAKPNATVALGINDNEFVKRMMDRLILQNLPL